MSLPGADGSARRPVEELPVEVRRSARRTRTVSARRERDRVVVHVPGRLSAAEESAWVTKLVANLAAKERSGLSDADLMQRALALSRRYLNGAAVPASVRWVGNQKKRWGSCTPADRTIRLSTELDGMPRYVVDSVILHELVHLLESGHTPRFWALLANYPQLERARGFLDGFARGAQWSMSEDDTEN